LARPDAKGLLAALSIAWHPALIAAVGGLPEWRRADDWPIPTAGAGFGQHDMDHIAEYEEMVTGEMVTGELVTARREHLRGRQRPGRNRPTSARAILAVS